MRNSIRSLFLVLLMIAPPPAFAAAWLLQESNSTVRSVTKSQTVRALPTSNSDDTDILDVTECENIDVGLAEDTDGNGTGATALTATLQWCPINNSFTPTDAIRDVACVDYDSGTLTGDDTIQGAGVPSGYVRLDMGGTFAGDPTIWLHCNGKP